MSRFIVRVTNYIFFAFIGLFLFVNIVRFSNYIAGGIFEYILMALLIVGVIAFFYFGERIFNKLRKVLSLLDRLSVLQMMLILFLFVAVTKIILVFVLGTELSGRGDMPQYVSFAQQLANDGVITDGSFYANMYRYTVVYALFLSPVVKLFGNDLKVILIFLSILYAVISVLLFDIIRPYAGAKKTFCGLMLFNIFPVGLFISQVVVHETGLLFFYVLSFWLLLKAMDQQIHVAWRIIGVILSAMLISFGTAINQGGKVVIISYIIFMVVYVFKDKFNPRKIGEMLFAIVCVAVCYVLITHICTAFVTEHIQFQTKEEEQYSTNAKENAVSFGWSIYLGSNYASSGEFNQEDFDTYHAYYDIADHDKAQEYQKSLIDERLQEYKNSPIKLPSHLYKKFKKIFGRPFVAIEYAINTNLHTFLTEHLNGYPMIAVRALGNFYNIIIAAIILFSYKKHRKKGYERYINPGLQFKLFVVGLTFALILFEMANKYVCHTQIIITCIGILSLSDFMSNSNMIASKLNKRRE